MSTRSDNHHADIPPTRTVKPMDAPPLTEGSTTAQLKGDIDSGRTGTVVHFTKVDSGTWSPVVGDFT